MAKLIWDPTGEKIYETGVDKGVLYPYADGKYDGGVAWNGLISVNESPSGAESTPLYANNKKYLNLRSSEDWAGSLSAYTYPDEFAECDGSASIAAGVTIGQQVRKQFGLSYRTLLGNDTEDTDHGYKIHIVYGCTAAPSELEHNTVNDTPEAIEMSWDLETTPVEVEGFKPTATVVIDSTKVDSTALKAFEDIIYGSADASARLPFPDEITSLFSKTTT